MLVIVCSWLDVLLLSGTGALVVVVNVDVDRGLLPRYDHIIRLSEYRNIGVSVCVSGLAC